MLGELSTVIKIGAVTVCPEKVRLHLQLLKNPNSYVQPASQLKIFKHNWNATTPSLCIYRYKKFEDVYSFQGPETGEENYEGLLLPSPPPPPKEKTLFDCYSPVPGPENGVHANKPFVFEETVDINNY